MFVPQFSIRWLFAITALCAGVFSVVALGVRGHRWALGVSAALAALVVLMLVYAVLFCVVWAMAVLMGRSGGSEVQAAGSPFAKPTTQDGNRPSAPEPPAAPILLE